VEEKKCGTFTSTAGSELSGNSKSGDSKSSNEKKSTGFTSPAGSGQSAGGTPAQASSGTAFSSAPEAGSPYLDPTTHKPFGIPNFGKCPPGCFTFTHGVASLAPWYVSLEVHDFDDEDVLAPPMQSASFPYELLEVHDLEDDDGVNVAPSEKPNYGYYLARRDPVSSVSEVNDLGDEDADIATAGVEM
jgi:hypothetical protein